MTRLDEHLGRDRILLLFAAAEDNAQWREQVRWVRDASVEEMLDRDLVVVQYIGSAEEARQRYDVPRDQPFAALLLGKDTGVKLRREQAVTLDEVFALIDTMPMRQQEMQHR